MKSLISSLRVKRGASVRHLFIFFWILSISNSIIFPAFTLSGEECEAPQRMFLNVNKKASVSFLGLFLELVLTTQGSSSDALLADAQDDGLDKLDFITSRVVALKNPEAVPVNIPLLTSLRLEIPDLSVISPPPKL